MIIQRKGAKQKFLFVCTGNTCRSPMAEAIFNFRLSQNRMEEDFSAMSAGLCAVSGEPVSPYAAQTLASHGIPCKNLFSKPLNHEMFSTAKVVLAMTERHKELVINDFGDGKTFTLLEYVAMLKGEQKPFAVDIMDPYGLSIKTYKAVFDTIDNCLEIIINNLQKEKIR